MEKAPLKKAPVPSLAAILRKASIVPLYSFSLPPACIIRRRRTVSKG